MRRKGQHVADRHVFAENQCEARIRATACFRRIRNAQIVARSAEWIEHGLARRQEAEPVRPAVVVRSSVAMLTRDMKSVRCTV